MSDPLRNSETDVPPWLDDEHPHEEEHCIAQIEGVIELLSPDPKRVLDLGCGAGRLVVPLAERGHEITGLDRDAEALARCKAALNDSGCSADLHQANFCDDEALPAGPFDAVLCLGNTLMTVAEVELAASLMNRISAMLTGDGVFLIDDCPADFWPEVIEGNWQSGISDDGSSQLVWDSSDAVFTLRVGESVDPDNWRIGSDEQRFRLWTDGALALACSIGGLSAPRRLAEARLLVMQARRS